MRIGLLLLLLALAVWADDKDGVHGSDEKELLECAYDAAEPVFDLEVTFKEEDKEVRNEYGYGLWTRWSRTTPKFLAEKAAWHSIIRLTTNKDHGNEKAPGDRTLVVWLGRASAKGFVWLNSNAWKTVDISAKHTPIKDYAHLLVKKEHGFPLFNGHIAHIHMRIGKGAFLAQDAAVQKLATGPLALLDEWRVKPKHFAEFLVEEEKEVKSTEGAFEVQTFEEDITDVTEYSISGWARQTDPEKAVPFQTLVRVALNEGDALKNSAQPGDRVFLIQRGNQDNYVFSTYTCDTENNCNFNLQEDVKYSNKEQYIWTYFYFGYSAAAKIAFGYVKYATEDRVITMNNVRHIVPTSFHVFLQKDPFFPGFNGAVRTWVFNSGKGAYKTDNFEKEKDDDPIHFGYALGIKQAHYLPGWEPEKGDEVVEQAFNNVTPAFEVEIKETEEAKLNGILEYGYGFWTRFLFNGPEKLINKPSILGVSRLATNENYKTDTRNPGDRTLAVFLIEGQYAFSTYSLVDQTDAEVSRNNIVSSVPYGQDLDGRWNYIYFGYKRISANSGVTKGYVAFNGKNVKTTSFGDKIVHVILTNYLYFAVGSSGSQIKTYGAFNGQITGVRLFLGQDSYINGEKELLALFDEIPKVAVEPLNKRVIDEQFNNDAEPHDLVDLSKELAGQDEYAIELWFRYVPEQKPAPESVIYVLTTNEEAKLQNNRQAGDRTLAIHRKADGTIVFSTYNSPEINDKFEAVQGQCEIKDPFQQTAWGYSYFGYSSVQKKAYYYFKVDATECRGELQAVHRVPKYAALFVGKDKFSKPFHGKLAYLNVEAGEEAYRVEKFQDTETFTDGFELFPTPFEWDGQADEILELSHDADDVLSEEFPDTKDRNMDGQQIYGFGFWCKYLMAYPSRLKQKPQWTQIARLTGLKENQDQTNIFDRVLTVFIGKGTYTFSTYNLVGNRMNQFANIEYGSSLEGVWNFIYFSYSNPAQTAQAFIYFSDRKVAVKQEMTGIDHRPLPGYAKFKMGKEFTYEGFNGLVTGIVVKFDGDAYVDTVEKFTNLHKVLYPIPEDQEHDAVEKIAQEDIAEKPVHLDLKDEFKLADEYSVFGWFKLGAAAVTDPKRELQVLFKLTNNDEELRKENPNYLGDKALALFLSQQDYQFITYNIGSIDAGSQAKVGAVVPFGDNLGVWTYVWMAYSRKHSQVNAYISFPHKTETRKIEKVRHFVPGHLELLVGDDGVSQAFAGKFQLVGAELGHGAYHHFETKGFEQNLPQVNEVDATIEHEYRAPQKERLLVSPPKEGDFVIEQEWEDDDISGVTEYGWGVWTRWLTVYPQWLQQKEAWHTIVRAQSTRTNENFARYGNRLLAAYVGRGFYQFATCSSPQANYNVVQNVDYGDDLEGHWNYIYFGYKKIGDTSFASAIVYFSVKNIIEHRKFEVAHIPILDYLRVRVAPKEFNYQPFHGQFYDLQIFVGQGFVPTADDFKKYILTTPHPEDDAESATSVSALEEITEVTLETDPEPKHIDDKEFAKEYSVSGWIKYDKITSDQLRIVFRLTTNDEKNMRDSQRPGDRTLAFLISDQSLAFSTYNFVNVDRFDETRDTLVEQQAYDGKFRAQWQFVYFGYSFDAETAYGTVIAPKIDPIVQPFKGINHLLPKDFYLYLGADGILPNFTGKLSHFEVHFGDGAYTETPKDLVGKSPENVIILQMPTEKKEEEKRVVLSKNKKLRKQRLH